MRMMQPFFGILQAVIFCVFLIQTQRLVIVAVSSTIVSENTTASHRLSTSSSTLKTTTHNSSKLEQASKLSTHKSTKPSSKRPTFISSKRPNVKVSLHISTPSITRGLVDYWGFNNNYLDAIRHKSLFNAHNASFTKDRRGRAKSALYLFKGYVQLPGAIYFEGGNYTTLTWAYIIRLTSGYQALYDCRISEADYDNIPGIYVSSHGQWILELIVNKASFHLLAPATIGKWVHIAGKLADSTISLFLDGKMSSKTTVRGRPRKVVRKYCFFGMSYNLLNGYLDDMMFFNRALTMQEILMAKNHYV